jgi:hypothetical protein
MHSAIKHLRSLRQELEALQPKVGIKKWGKIVSSLRVAGQPRSVSAAVEVLIMTDLIADQEVKDEQFKTAVQARLERFKRYAAFHETAWLDQGKLKKYLAEFRANGYRPVAGYKWIENREKNPYPYVDKD